MVTMPPAPVISNGLLQVMYGEKGPVNCRCGCKEPFQAIERSPCNKAEPSGLCDKRQGKAGLKAIPVQLTISEPCDRGPQLSAIETFTTVDQYRAFPGLDLSHHKNPRSAREKNTIGSY
ncbi:hypothetical protein RRG08_028515 [Elysia crispata]|uniref:Uncharacterized protein n=1 Tax=Elysia crispata TaxID=231223 RepID=A0AAE0Y9G5_9GAST|nr:hypothetical protein RRG08_028515 [Elysia crispata]